MASVGACDIVLALSKVIKSLRAACNDRVIYKAIIDQHNENTGPKWRHHLPLSLEHPPSTWAHYALADSKAALDHTLSLEPEPLVS